MGLDLDTERLICIGHITLKQNLFRKCKYAHSKHFTSNDHFAQYGGMMDGTCVKYIGYKHIGTN